MQKSKSQVPNNIQILQKYTFDQDVYYGLPVIKSQDSSTWTVCCQVWQVDTYTNTRTQVVNLEDLQSFLIDIAKKNVVVEVKTIRTTKTGKIVYSGSVIVESGGNEGKVNETTVLQSAIVKMQATYRKMSKSKQGTNEESKEQTTTVIPKINPMLLGLYKYQSKSTERQIQFPCFIQRKYDGLRCIAIVSYSGQVVLQSRGQCEYTNLKHINTFIQTLIPGMGLTEGQCMFLDGELYSHGLSLQKINSLIKNESSDTRCIQLRVFDCGFINDNSKGFSQRLDFLKSILSVTENSVQLVPTELAQNEQQIDQYMDQFLQEHYEGAVLRDFGSLYVYSVNNKRSNTTLKYKKRDDLEVQVVNYTCGQARDKDAVVFVCQYQQHTFNVVQNTSIQVRKQQYQYLQSNPKALEQLQKIPLTIEYSGFSETGVPQQPRGIVFRFDIVTDKQVIDQLKTIF